MALKLWEKVNSITGQPTKSRKLLPSLEAGARFLVASLPEKFLWSIASTIEVDGWSSTQTASVTASCGTTSDSPTVTLSSTTGLQVGMLVTGTGIPNGTTISSIVTNTSLGLSKDATASATLDLVFKHTLAEGSGISYDKILSVYREDGFDSNGNKVKRIAEEVSDKGVHIFDEANSLLRPTKMFPKFYKLAGKIYIKPAPDYNDSTTNQAYTKVGASSTTSITAGTGDKGVIVYAAPPTIDENTEQWILAEYENVALYYACSLDMKRLCQTYRDTITTHLSTITGTYLVNFESTLPTYIKVPAPVALVLPTLSGTQIDITMDSIPDYVDQTMTSLPSVTALLTVDGYPVPPDMPTLTMPTLVPAPNITYVPPSDITLTNTLTISGVALPDFSLPQHTFDWTNTDDALSKAQNLIDTSESVGGDLPGTATAFDSAQEWLEEEDPEMVTSVLNTAAQEVSRAQTSMAKEQRKLEEYSQKSDAEMSRYQNQVAKYRAAVEKASSELQNKVASYNASVQNQQMVMQSQVDKYDKDLARYQADVAQRIQEFQQKSETKINEFSALATSRVQEYSGEATSVINKFKAEASSHTAKYTAIEEVRMAEYSAKVQEKLGTYTQKATQAIGQFREKANAAVSEWREKSNVYIQEYSAKVQEAVQKYQSKSGTAVSKFNAELQEAVQEEQRKTQAFSAESNQVIQDYGAKLQQHQSDIGQETQDFGGKMQKAGQYLAEAGALVGVINQLNTQCQMAQQDSQDYYQRSIGELKAITGMLTAPPQQQQEQRKEQGSAT